jgi:regulatory protein
VERPPPSKPSAAARALRLLARRDYTRRELAEKLSADVTDYEELEALLDEFTDRGWLSEERVVEQVVNAKAGRFGPLRIRKTLLERGVPEALIAPALESLKATELESARTLWARKFRPPQTPAEKARQVRFLQSRGFSLDVAMRVVRSDAREEDGER